LDISVIGAAGDIGREIVAQIVAGGVLKPTERLQLVGRAGGTSEGVLFGLRSDLTDAYAETAPQLDIALAPEDVVGDVIVMAAGGTLKAAAGRPVSRDDVATINAPIFEAYARSLGRYGQGQEIVLVVTNPVELGVAIFADHIGTRRVIGMGAYSDSLRFRREVAADLGVPRQLVSGYVAGEHGTNLVPLWSSVRVYGMNTEETQDAVARLRCLNDYSEFQQRVAQARISLQTLLTTSVPQTFERVEEMPPDMRVLLRPELTHLSGSKTVMATANATVDMVRQIVEGREISVAGQIMLDGLSAYGLHGVMGLPLILSNQGVVRVQTPTLWPEEERALRDASRAITQKIATWRAN
jgi:malate dehydrogenase